MPNLRELRRDRIASARSVIPTDHGSVRGHRVDLGPLSQLSGVRRNSDYTYLEGMERYIARHIPRNVQYHNPERCNDLAAFVTHSATTDETLLNFPLIISRSQKVLALGQLSVPVNPGMVMSSPSIQSYQ